MVGGLIVGFMCGVAAVLTAKRLKPGWFRRGRR